jgi:hypothetical protein
MKCIAKVANIAKLSEKTKRQAAEIEALTFLQKPCVSSIAKPNPTLDG